MNRLLVLSVILLVVVVSVLHDAATPIRLEHASVVSTSGLATPPPFRTVTTLSEVALLNVPPAPRSDNRIEAASPITGDSITISSSKNNSFRVIYCSGT